MADEIGIHDLEEAQRWTNIQHRMLVKDAAHIATLYTRIAWLAQPWWRRAFRRPPWYRHPERIEGVVIAPERNGASNAV